MQLLTIRPHVLRSLPLLILAAPATAQDIQKRDQPDVFRQLEELLPTPGPTRTASGAPGAEYWQQRADYDIEVALEEHSRRITGVARIQYTNNSPDALGYLWVQLDNNQLSSHSDGKLARTTTELDSLSYGALESMLAREEFEGGIDVLGVRDGAGAALPHTVVGTMMRVDLPAPVSPGMSVPFEVEWTYIMNRSDQVGARTGAEWFEEDGNWLFEVAHWFPRMAMYSDSQGWHNKQFLGRGEFTLEFGDYKVAITVPADHVVASTGELQNPGDVLTSEQQARLEQAATADQPMFIVTPEEALENQAEGTDATQTWVFEAENVRDFAWASSRKFAWDAWGRPVEDRTVMCMSYFPNEGEPLWSRYSTQSIAHTLEVYGEHTFPYPYPIAISVNGPVGGMEYPMICFNGPRPEEDGTYSERTKYGLISVIIHEVGHNWFPMIVNSDERQWTWMDEGLNTFCQYLAESTWEESYPSRRGEPAQMTSYMKSPNQVPIMTNSESILQFGSNAYGKPATALNVLRETVMGRELFDFAFAEYSKRWMFKHPRPADLFRTMEDASAIDLDWFWRGWFYTTDHVDIAITGLERYTLDNGDPEIAKAKQRAEREAEPVTRGKERNASLEKRTSRYPELLDFYNSFDELEVTPADRRNYEELVAKLEDQEAELLGTPLHFSIVRFENQGGLVMPLILDLHFSDGTTEEVRLPAEIWTSNSEQVAKLLITELPIDRVVLDPHLELADTDLSDNEYPPKPVDSRFKLFKRGESKNPMQKAIAEEERAAQEAEELAEQNTEEAGAVEATTESEAAGTQDARER